MFLLSRLSNLLTKSPIHCHILPISDLRKITRVVHYHRPQATAFWASPDLYEASKRTSLIRFGGSLRVKQVSRGSHPGSGLALITAGLSDLGLLR